MVEYVLDGYFTVKAKSKDTAIKIGKRRLLNARATEILDIHADITGYETWVIDAVVIIDAPNRSVAEETGYKIFEKIRSIEMRGERNAT